MQRISLVFSAVLWLMAAGGFSSAEARIAYVANDSANFSFKLYVMEDDGSNPTRVGDVAFGIGNTEFYTVAWSPEGSHLALKYRADLCIIDVDTGAIETVIDGGTNNNPTWAPDGRRIAVSRSLSGQRDIWLVNTDGTELTNLTNSPDVSEYYPAWSPDGSSLVFMSDLRNGERDLFLMQLADGTQQRLTNDTPRNIGPVFSPDGSRILYTEEEDPSAFVSNIVMIDADGGNSVRLTDSTAASSRMCCSNSSGDGHILDTGQNVGTDVWAQGLGGDEFHPAVEKCLQEVGQAHEVVEGLAPRPELHQ